MRLLKGLLIMLLPVSMVALANDLVVTVNISNTTNQPLQLGPHSDFASSGCRNVKWQIPSNIGGPGSAMSKLTAPADRTCKVDLKFAYSNSNNISCNVAVSPSVLSCGQPQQPVCMPGLKANLTASGSGGNCQYNLEISNG